jgi:hypothetical protein
MPITRVGGGSSGGYDGSVKIDTKMDTGGINDGLKDVENSTKKTFGSVASTTDETGGKVNALSGIFAAMTGGLSESLTNIIPIIGETFAGLSGGAIAAGVAIGVVAIALVIVVAILVVIVAVMVLIVAAFVGLVIVVKNLVVGIVQFSVNLINSMAGAMDVTKGYGKQVQYIKDLFDSVKQATYAAFSPLLALALPYITEIVHWLITMLNLIGMIMAALLGQAKVWQYVEGSTKGATNAAKGALAAFDKINVLSQGAGSGAGKFISVDVDPAILQKSWDKLKKWWNDVWLKIFGDKENVGLFREWWDPFWFQVQVDWDMYWYNVGIGWHIFWVITIPAELNLLRVKWDSFWAARRVDWDAYWREIDRAWEYFWLIVVHGVVETWRGKWDQFWFQVKVNWDMFWFNVGIDWDTFWLVTVHGVIETWGGKWNQFWFQVKVDWDMLLFNIGIGWDTFWTVTIPGAIDEFKTNWDQQWFQTKVDWDMMWFNIGVDWDTFWTVTLPGAWTSFPDKWNAFWAARKENVRTIMNDIIGFINAMIQGMIGGINSAISALNSIHVTTPKWWPAPYGGVTVGFNLPSVSAPPIPLLATGAVIPPNSAFAAILGDQRSGVNVEAPEALIRKIVREESNKSITLNFAGSLSSLIRVLKPYIEQDDIRTGTSLLSGE